VGVFGFLAHPELTRESPHHASGNYGLLDQAAACAGCGTTSRRSAGILVTSPSPGSRPARRRSARRWPHRSPALIAGAIGESGGMIYPSLAPVPLEEAERAGVEFARRVAAGSLAALRALPADSLLKATSRPGSGRWPATVDGYSLTGTPADVFAVGDQAHVPLLIGWNSEEADWRKLLGSQEPTPQNYAVALRTLFGELADEALRLFPGATQSDIMASATFLAGARHSAYSTWKWAELHRGSGSRCFVTTTRTRGRPRRTPPRTAAHGRRPLGRDRVRPRQSGHEPGVCLDTGGRQRLHRDGDVLRELHQDGEPERRPAAALAGRRTGRHGAGHDAGRPSAREPEPFRRAYRFLDGSTEVIRRPERRGHQDREPPIGRSRWAACSTVRRPERPRRGRYRVAWPARARRSSTTAPYAGRFTVSPPWYGPTTDRAHDSHRSPSP